MTLEPSPACRCCRGAMAANRLPANTNGYNPPIYLQVVWKGTTAVGCAMVPNKCGGFNYVSAGLHQ